MGSENATNLSQKSHYLFLIRIIIRAGMLCNYRLPVGDHLIETHPITAPSFRGIRFNFIQ